MSRPVGRPTLVGLALISLVVGHHLIFLVAYGTAGYDEAMRAGGHDGYWIPFAATVGVLSVILAAIVGSQVRRLSRLASEVAAGNVEAGDDYREVTLDAVRLTLRLTVATAFLFVVQENVEHLSAGSPLPFLGALGGTEYGPTLPLLGLVSLAVSLVTSLVRWRRHVLARRIGAAFTKPVRPAVAGPGRGWLDVLVVGSVIGRRLAGRAPPRTSAA